MKIRVVWFDLVTFTYLHLDSGRYTLNDYTINDNDQRAGEASSPALPCSAIALEMIASCLVCLLLCRFAVKHVAYQIHFGPIWMHNVFSVIWRVIKHYVGTTDPILFKKMHLT